MEENTNINKEEIKEETPKTEPKFNKENGEITKDNKEPKIPPAPEPAGTLFESIAYQNAEDIPHFLENMKPQDAAFIMMSAAKLGHKKGIFTLVESELVSKAIRILTTPPPNMNMQPQPDMKVVPDEELQKMDKKGYGSEPNEVNDGAPPHA